MTYPSIFEKSTTAALIAHIEKLVVILKQH